MRDCDCCFNFRSLPVLDEQNNVYYVNCPKCVQPKIKKISEVEAIAFASACVEDAFHNPRFKRVRGA